MARTKTAVFPAEEDPAVHERFRAAMRQVITLETRERHGIGMQKEKTLHAVLKCFKEPDPDRQEIPIGNYIADIYNREGITEIQTAHLGNLRAKLDTFLPLFPVRVVYPIAHRKRVIWIDPDTGEQAENNLSTHIGTYYTAFRELYRIRPYLTRPGLTLELLLIDLEEYRIKDGWSRDRKRGSHRFDTIPVSLQGELVLERPEDYMQLVPENLPEPFTAADFAAAAGIPRELASTVMLLLTETGTVLRVGRQGRAWLYRLAEF
jgi:hypothetical protein